MFSCIGHLALVLCFLIVLCVLLLIGISLNHGLIFLLPLNVGTCKLYNCSFQVFVYPFVYPLLYFFRTIQVIGESFVPSGWLLARSSWIVQLTDFHTSMYVLLFLGVSVPRPKIFFARFEMIQKLVHVISFSLFGL